MLRKAFWTVVAALLTAVVWNCTPVLAQGYPSKPVTLVVPYSPGGAVDLLARTLAQRMSENMGQQIVVENRSGASGMIGTEFVAHAAPDGYTIGLGTDATHAIDKFTNKAMAYDPVKDFTPIIEAVEMPIVLAVHSSVPANTAKEFVEYVKKNPGKISFGTPGTGSPHHLAGELLKQVTGIDMVHVPYRGTGPSMQDLIGGQIPAIFSSLSAAVPQMRSGKIKVLGLVEAKRQPSAPDIPTIGESIPEYAMQRNTLGFFGPAGLPAPIVARLHTEFMKALYAPDVRAKIEAAGMPLIGSSSEEFATQVKEKIELYRNITAAAGIKPE